MSQALLNLSTRPFVNLRPVVRLSLLLWLVGALLLAGNLWLYWDFLAGRGDLDARRREAAEAVEVERNRIRALSTEFDRFDLGSQNEQVIYLNQRIEQRRFSWSRLFDELAALLPQETRLTSLRPSAEEEGGARSGRSSRASARGRAGQSVLGDGKVLLAISGRARSDQAILDFVDALFAAEDFERPNLLQQARQQGQDIQFTLEVLYQPEISQEPEILTLEDAESAGGEAETDGDSEADTDAEAGPGEAPGRRPVALGRPASSPRDLS